ncbi:hypothetical protein ACKWTF_001161 [Chironomus riparius]
MHHGGGGGLGWAFSSFFADSSVYGNSFGTKGLPDDSYISKNDYRHKESNGFLISSLFNGRWNEEKDKEWRESTRAPYFENKIPDDEKLFPASAVLGAATAFGLVTLLPLNVPPGKPLMYCDSTKLIQSQIRINDQDIYVCNNRKIEILCKKKSENSECLNEELQCDLHQGITDNIYCTQNTLLSRTYLFCSSTSTIHKKDSNENVTIVNCFEGQLPKSRVSFIPTTTTTTESPFFTPTPKPLSLSANVHIFLIKLIGKHEALETTTRESYPVTEDNYAWYPEALTIPPETTTQKPIQITTKLPYVWMEKVHVYHENGTVETTFRPAPIHYQPYSFKTDPIILPNWYQIYTTSTEAFKETTTVATTKKPYTWMRKVFSSDHGDAEKLEPVPKDLVEIAEQFSPFFPSNWVKVSNGKILETTTESFW